MRKIISIIKPNGTTIRIAQGFEGEECHEAMQEIFESVNKESKAKVTVREYKEDFPNFNGRTESNEERLSNEN